MRHLSTAEMQLKCDSLEGAIQVVEAEAAAADAKQARSDAQIVLDFAFFKAENKMKPDCFYDAGVGIASDRRAIGRFQPKRIGAGAGRSQS
jgi:hypothetical protein